MLYFYWGKQSHDPSCGSTTGRSRRGLARPQTRSLLPSAPSPPLFQQHLWNYKVSWLGPDTARQQASKTQGLLWLCPVPWASLLKGFACASSGVCSQRQEHFQQLMSAQGDKETTALALLLIELFQNTRFIAVRWCSTKHWHCKGCSRSLQEPGMLTSLPPLPERGLNCNATSKSQRHDPLLHNQQHQLIISVSSRVGSRPTKLNPQLLGLGKRCMLFSSAITWAEWVLSYPKSLFCVRRKTWVALSKLLEVLSIKIIRGQLKSWHWVIPANFLYFLEMLFMMQDALLCTAERK